MRTLLERDGDLCHVCELPFTDKRPPTLDHLTELRNGGNWTLENLKLAHESCNNYRSNKPESENPEWWARMHMFWVRAQFGIVPIEFPGDPKRIQPIRIVGQEWAPSRLDPSLRQGWFWGRYA